MKVDFDSDLDPDRFPVSHGRFNFQDFTALMAFSSSPMQGPSAREYGWDGSPFSLLGQGCRFLDNELRGFTHLNPNSGE